VRSVFYLDDEAGFVRTYDMDGKGTMCAVSDPKVLRADVTDGGMMFREIHGVVELKPL